MSLLREAEKAMKPTEDDWNYHKETIKLLYCIEDRDLVKGPHNVQEEMKRRYDFVADKYEYEKHLKQWKFRKNLKKEEWISIKPKILARKRAGKDSEVSCEGVPIPAKRVKRSIRRYGSAGNETIPYGYDSVTSPQTPDGITITTPKAMEDNPEVCGNLPISQYFAALLHQATIPPVPSTVSSAFQVSPNIFLPFSSIPKVVKFQSQICGLLSDSDSVPTSGPWVPDLGTDSYDVSPPGHELFHVFPDYTETLRAIHFLISFVSNGHLGMEEYSIYQGIIKWFQQENNGPLLRLLLSVSGPTATSIIDALYPYAIVAGKASIVKIFLDLGCSPNNTLNNGRGLIWFTSGVTVLGFACEFRNIELARTLLTAGANPNMLSKCESPKGEDHRVHPIVLSIWGDSGHYMAITSEERGRDEVILSLIRLLIRHGAGLDNAFTGHHLPLVEAVQKGYQRVARLLLDEGADVNSADRSGNLPLAIAIKNHKSGSPAEIHQSLAMVLLLLNAGADVNVSFGRYRWWLREVGILPLDAAAVAGSLELAELLYSRGARPSSSTLACAVEGKNEDLVRFILKIVQSESNILVQRTALMAAIRSNKIELFRLIFEVEPGHNRYTLASAVETAVSSRMYDVVPSLLASGLRYPEFPNSLQPALSSAVSSGNLHIVELLLSIGVKPNNDMLEQAFKSRHELVIKKLLELEGTLWTLGQMEDSRDEGDESDRSDDSDDSDEAWSERENNKKICQNCWMKAHSAESSLWIAAVGYGNRDIVLRLMERGRPLTDTKALVKAIDCHNVDVVMTLLEAGSPINASACDGYMNVTPLQAAVLENQPSIVRVLLEYGADPELRSISDSFFTTVPRPTMSPLQLSIERRHCEIAAMLLQAGADINSSQAEALGESALTLAIRTDDQQTFDFVLAHGADRLDSMALLEAVKQEDTSLVEGLLKSSLSPGARYSGTYGTEALREAVWKMSTDLVRLLLSAGIDPNKLPTRHDHCYGGKTTALGIAISHFTRYGVPKPHVCERGFAIIETLLQAGANSNGIIDEPGRPEGRRTALVAAVETKNVSLVTLLLQHGANPNEYPKGAIRRSPLQRACESGHLRIVQLLLNHNVDVNAPPAWYRGGTALQLASISGNVQIVLALLDRGADMNAPAARVEGRSALEGAAEHRRLDAVIALLEAGVGIYGPYEGQYRRALKFAEQNGWRAVHRELLARTEGTSE